MHYVYVLDKKGKPLMPTTKFGKVRRMLKDGRVKIAQSEPFTIRLTYEPDTHYIQKEALDAMLAEAGSEEASGGNAGQHDMEKNKRRTENGRP